MSLSRVRRGVSLIVVTHQSAGTLDRFLEHLERVTGPQDEIILIDNASTDASRSLLATFAERSPEGRRLVASNENLGYAAAVNLGLHYVDRHFVALLHPDVLPEPTWLERMIDHLAAHRGSVAIAPGSGPGGSGGTSDGAIEVPVLDGGCQLFISDAIDRALGLDERYFFGGEIRSMSRRLRQQGGRLLRATDVTATSIGDVPDDPKERLRRRYLRLTGEQRFAQEMFRAPQDEARPMLASDEFAPDRSRLSVVIPVMDNLALTRKCIESIYQHTPHELELIVVDNGSQPDVGRYVQQLASLKSGVIYIRNEVNEGFGYACNQGFARATGAYIALLNNDVQVTEDWFARLLSMVRLDAKIALAGPMTNRASGPQVVPDGAYSDAADADHFAEAWGKKHPGEYSLATRIVGLCWVMRRGVVDEVGGFDPCFWLGNFEDDDLCLRIARRGWVAAIAHDAFVHHEGSATWRESNIDHTALMLGNWRWFCHKYGHTAPLGTRYPARELALKHPFHSERDFIAVDDMQLYAESTEPLHLEGAREHRLLLFADIDDAMWEATLLDHVQTHSSADRVTLVVRIEPPTPEVVEKVGRRIEAVLAASGQEGNDVPDVLLETTPLSPSRRAGLFRAVDGLLVGEGGRAGLHEREARLCGVPMITSGRPIAS